MSHNIAADYYKMHQTMTVLNGSADLKYNGYRTSAFVDSIMDQEVTSSSTSTGCPSPTSGATRSQSV